VIGLARFDRTLRSRVDRLRRADADIVVPIVVIAETVRGNGPRDARVNLVLAGCSPSQPLDESTARLAGQLLAVTGGANTIDALVAAEAVQRAPSVVLTSDPDDLSALLADHPDVLVAPI
jgi:predicted nucleic acid-binding protein